MKSYTDHDWLFPLFFCLERGDAFSTHSFWDSGTLEFAESKTTYRRIFQRVLFEPWGMEKNSTPVSLMKDSRDTCLARHHLRWVKPPKDCHSVVLSSTHHQVLVSVFMFWSYIDACKCIPKPSDSVLSHSDLLGILIRRLKAGGPMWTDSRQSYIYPPGN